MGYLDDPVGQNLTHHRDMAEVHVSGRLETQHSAGLGREARLIARKVMKDRRAVLRELAK